MIVIDEHGFTVMLRALVSTVARLHLFTNPPGGKPGEVLAETFIEPATADYAPREVGLGSWTFGDRSAKCAECLFEFKKAFGDSVHGWYATDAAGLVVLKERFEKPINFTEFGGRVRVSPTLTLKGASK